MLFVQRVIQILYKSDGVPKADHLQQRHPIGSKCAVFMFLQLSLVTVWPSIGQRSGDKHRHRAEFGSLRQKMCLPGTRDGPISVGQHSNLGQKTPILWSLSPKFVQKLGVMWRAACAPQRYDSPTYISVIPISSTCAFAIR